MTKQLLYQKVRTPMHTVKQKNNRRPKTYLKNILCLLLAAALFLAGCSSPSSGNKNAVPGGTNAQNSEGNSSNSGKLSSDEKSEQDSSNGQSSEDSDSGGQSDEDSDSSGQSSEDSSSGEQSSEDSDSEEFSFSQSLPLKTPEPAAGENPRILFVGNSHTYTNDLPVIFSEIAGAMGHPADVQEITAGAYTLTQFADETDEVGSVVNQRLTEETWDFVILQENTNDAFSAAEEAMLPAASSLDEKIRAAGGQTGILMTWTPKDGAGIMDREYVQSILAQNTIAVSERLDSLLIPGGVGFMRCLEQYPQIELWDEDGMHPSLEGSYLAGCIAYAVIFRESPAGCSYTAELDAETAAQLQEVAAGFLAE